MAEREERTWDAFGSAGREPAAAVTADGSKPDLILSIARGGRFVAGAHGHVLDNQNPVVRP